MGRGGGGGGGFPGDSVVKNLPANAEVTGLILGLKDPLEKEMATHSSILPGKSHRQRTLGGYSPWGLKRVRHDLATKTKINTFYDGMCLLEFLLIPIWPIFKIYVTCVCPIDT